MGNLVAVQVKGNIGTIDDNLDMVEVSIREKIKEYAAVVITEDSVKDGKKFLADIRKEKKALDDERKAIKSQWMAPYEAFEKRAKKIISLYDEPVNIINEQLKDFEDQRKEMKKQEIAGIYDFVKGDFEDWLPLSRIYNAKWENTTYSGKKIREDMELLFDQMKLSIQTVKSMESEFEKEALEVLKETGSLQNAISKINELKAQKEWFEERMHKEEELKSASENTEQKTEPEASKPSGPAQISDVEYPFAYEKMFSVRVKIRENDLQKLKDFLDSLQFEYEVICNG